MGKKCAQMAVCVLACASEYTCPGIKKDGYELFIRPVKFKLLDLTAS